MKRRDFVAGMPALAAFTGFGAAAMTPAEPLKGDIVLGQTADFTASRSSITKAYAEGAALLFDDVNSSGGVNGRKIRLLQVDDGYDTDRAVLNARNLAADKSTFALIHLVGTAIVESVLPIIEGTGIPLIHPITGADQVRPPKRVVNEAFFLRASYGREIDRIVSQLKTLNIGSLGLLHENETFGHLIRDSVHEAAQKYGVKVIATGVLQPNQTSETAVGPAIDVLAKAAPPAIIIGSAGPSVEQFIKGYHGASGRSQLYCLSVSNVDRLYKALGPLVAGIVVTQVMPSSRTSVLPVVGDYRLIAAARKIPTSGFGLEGYISARVIVQALREAGPQLTRGRFITALESQSQVGGFPVKYRDPHQGSPFVELAMISSAGKLVI